MNVSVVVTSNVEEIRVEVEIIPPVRDWTQIQETVQRCANAAQAYFDSEETT